MTEVQKYQGKFIQKQREQKEHAKKEKVVEKLEPTKPQAQKEEKTSKEATPNQEEQISADEAIKLRKLLKNETEFRGFVETASLLLKNEKDGLKLKSLSKKLLKTFRLSEDYDSDSDASDDENKLYAKGHKAISKHLKQRDEFVVDDKVIKLK